MADSEQWIIVGKVTSAHGIRGEVKATLFIDDPEVLYEVESLFLEGRQRKEMKVDRVRLTRNQAIIAFAEITDRNEAERLRGRELSIPMEWLPDLEEDEYYVAEIVGLSVETVEGEVLGTVEEVIFTGANEVYVVRGGPRGEILLPAIESVVQDVDLENSRICVILPEGLVD